MKIIGGGLQRSCIELRDNSVTRTMSPNFLQEYKDKILDENMWKSTYLSSAQPNFPMLFDISSSSALSSLANSKISLQGIVQHVSPPETTICSWSATPFTWVGFSFPLFTVFMTGSPALWASWGCSLCRHVTPSVVLLESLRAHCSALMWFRWMWTRIEVATSPADARKVSTRTTFLLNMYSCKEWQNLGHKNIIVG